jgi:hypothetical protein
MKRPIFYGALIILILLLGSCIGIDSTVTFNKDGSGMIKMEYRISNSFTEMNEEGGTPPLPLSQESLRAALKDSSSLELISVKQRKDEKDTYITAEIKFKAIEALTSLEAFSSMPMSLSKQGEKYKFEQLITEGESTTDDESVSEAITPEGTISSGELPDNSENSTEMYSDEELQAIMAPYFDGYELKFTVKTPAPIRNYNLGVLSQDKKSITYTLPLLQMQNLKEKTLLIVEW